jgi:hypothetical protein
MASMTMATASSGSALHPAIEDVSSQLEVLQAANATIHYALDALTNIPSDLERQALFPHVRDFVAVDPVDIEIQQFNLCRKIPVRMQSNDELAAWMLETDTLNRFNVAMYLASQSTSNAGTFVNTCQHLSTS